MINIGYRAARLRGKIMRSLYKRALTKIVKIPIPQTQRLEIAVYSLSCERDLPEQVASIRSFIRYVGIPEQFTVISDGSYSRDSCQLLRRIHPCVEVVEQKKLVRTDLPQCIYDYAENHPLGKKLAALMSIPINKVTIYTDSDILFFPEASELITLAALDDNCSRYLLDCAISLDERILDDESEKLNPVNSGLILFKKQLDWSFAIERLVKFQESPNYFTEQTIVHLTMHYNKNVPLCSKRYVVSLDDQFIYPDNYASQKVALRHYVNPVRHKFWFNVGI
jgi:hypothetical protein